MFKSFNNLAAFYLICNVIVNYFLDFEFLPFDSIKILHYASIHVERKRKSKTFPI